MTKARTGAERYLAGLKKDPEFAGAYEEAVRRIRTIDNLVRALEAARVEQGLTKAELARRAGMQPEAVRRLFSVDRPNPTAVTLAALASVLNLELVAQPAFSSNRRPRANRNRAPRASAG